MANSNAEKNPDAPKPRVPEPEIQPPTRREPEIHPAESPEVNPGRRANPDHPEISPGQPDHEIGPARSPDATPPGQPMEIPPVSGDLNG